jgi:hypothetical protein
VTLSVANLYPSRHLNMADCYCKLGELGPAREHLELARAGIGARPDDDCGRLIRAGFATLSEQLSGGA